ncbi:MAG: uracil-DNA glycosylase [Candidatus Marinimicrobia bacterium]|nr:uracil-DNA glycosylase [Candidatus Neomarinimicrobiota bacterium]
MKSIQQLNEQIITCRKCERLVTFREKIASEKRKQFMDWTYWGKPVIGYGHDNAKLLIVGLAPAAHGGNRTGRVFTGDKSADFLLMCLHTAGMANQPNSDHRDDGLNIYDGYMTPVLKCVPPGDKPTAEELRTCFEYFTLEMALLTHVSVILTLGKIAHDNILKYYQAEYSIKKSDYPFGHFKEYILPDKKVLISSYHPSPRNVNTKRLTKEMMLELFTTIKDRL